MTQQSTVGRFITDVRCTEHNANLEIGNGTKWRDVRCTEHNANLEIGNGTKWRV